MNAYDLDKAGFYKEHFNIDSISDLGCVMLDVEPEFPLNLPKEVGYHSTHLDRKWISGVQSEFHITLLYGLLINANKIQEEVKGLLRAGILFQSFETTEIDIFSSPFADESYDCVVMRVHNGEVNDAHRALSAIPHINTFPRFKAHITLGYIRREFTEMVVSYLEGKTFKWNPIGLNFGYPEES